MARPKLGQGDSERLHMVISAEEMEAIEDWRFRNRVQSKSEAVRRLCQIGKDMETVIPNATDHADDMLSSVRMLYVMLDRSAKAQEDGGKVDMEELLGRAEDLLDRAEDIHLILMRENDRIIPLAETRGIKIALATAAAGEAQVSEFIEAYLSGEQNLRESKLMREVVDEMSPDQRAHYRKMEPEQQAVFLQAKVGAKRVANFRARHRQEEPE